MRLLFMGTSPFAEEILRAVAEDARFTLPAVYAKREDSAAAKRARALGVAEVRTPPALTGETTFLRSLKLDAGLVADYGLRVPAEILALPRFGFINAHPSLLPRWRGAAPIERAIMAGDSHIGVAVMRMVEELDAGDVFSCERVAVLPEETAGELRARLAPMAASACIRVLEALRRGEAQAHPQGEAGACYAEKLRGTDGRLDWRETAAGVARRVRACAPSPGAWFEAERNGRVMRIGVSRARLAEGEGAPGTVLDDAPRIACGSGALLLLQLQREGKKPMSAAEFLRGFPLPAGTRLPLPEGG